MSSDGQAHRIASSIADRLLIGGVDEVPLLARTGPGKTHIISVGTEDEIQPGQTQGWGELSTQARLVVPIADGSTPHLERIGDGEQDEAIKEYIRTALQAARDVPPGERLIVHCFAGVNRSTAMALAIIADAYGKGREENAVQRLLQLREFAAPNLGIVRLADQVLGRNGALLAAAKQDAGIAERLEASRKATQLKNGELTDAADKAAAQAFIVGVAEKELAGHLQNGNARMARAVFTRKLVPQGVLGTLENLAARGFNPRLLKRVVEACRRADSAEAPAEKTYHFDPRGRSFDSIAIGLLRNIGARLIRNPASLLTREAWTVGRPRLFPAAAKRPSPQPKF